jgi:hypothetical protein
MFPHIVGHATKFQKVGALQQPYSFSSGYAFHDLLQGRLIKSPDLSQCDATNITYQEAEETGFLLTETLYFIFLRISLSSSSGVP